MNYVAAPVIEDGKIKGIARVSLELQGIELLIRESTRRTILLSITIWVVTLILTFLFSSVFSSSVNRVSNLISDLLLLSRLETPARTQINFEKVRLTDIAEDVTKLVERPAKDKNSDLKIEPTMNV